MINLLFALYALFLWILGMTYSLLLWVLGIAPMDATIVLLGGG